MSEELKPTPQNEEVDLGQLFKMIGNMFQKFFDFIAKIFKGLFHVLILILAHFFKRLKWYALAGFVGLVIGYFLDRSSDKLYGANMFIQTNFNSGYQVYENIKNLNELATEEDVVRIAEILNIDTTYASKLKGFYIEPAIDENVRFQMFSNYKKGLDSIGREEAKYDVYVSSLSNYNFNRHKIGVASIDKNIYPMLDTTFVNAISKNEYLNEVLRVNQDNFDRQDTTLIKQEKEMDNLIKSYLEIRNKEADKKPIPGAGTNISLGDAQKNELLVNEAPLVKEKLELAAKRRSIEKDKVTQKNIISVISDFPVTGYDIQEWHQDLRFLMPAIFIGVTLLLFSLIGLNKFVKEYEGIK
ncbi:hypothetical protein [Winogradskyella immobilis]|uniref:Chain length determinant protein n=1 Tax=Winogradskyella immobilis TaxID=2816852 RepID=A0ABS8EJU9_9FLAO|nr:hypothetical protein [Winogradskyella immobilis]MCC1483468.1 hypothetical protein [Winogradskyella immobilis]MCG0015562.1 hypothetical protein [Winogradskyella immobilis]